MHGSHESRRWSARAACAASIAIVLCVFLPTVGFDWLNWDDQEIFTRTLELHAGGVVEWAFRTTRIGHYQPLAWLTWATIDRLWGLTPATTHLLNVVVHAACAGLVFSLARRLGCGIAGAMAASLLFAIHPLQAEVVAWASAMPYALASFFALLSVLAFLDPSDGWAMAAAAVVLFATSLLARPIALGLPVALAALAVERRQPRRFLSIRRRTVIVSCALLAVGAALLEASARDLPALSEVGPGVRLTLATTAPFRYMWRTVFPVGLTPLDPLALEPRADIPLILVSAIGLAAVCWGVWRWRHRAPGAAVAWVCYLALLAPAMGLVPSGLQATATRYAYLPAIPVAILIGAAVTRLRVRFLPHAVFAMLALLALLTYRQTNYWRDSVALWTRAVEVDPRNDVALYNLAAALADAGRRDEALQRYDDVLRIVPDQTTAKRNRDLLRATGLEEEGNRLAASSRWVEAIDRYQAALSLDPRRTHSRAALGMALVRIGRTSEAVPHLREAIDLGASEPSISNALAFALVQTGRVREACAVLQAARLRFADDDDVRRNLEQLSNECGQSR
jgi:Flp pilus assembly protein TadD